MKKNVLGIVFDSKLQWSNQVSTAIQKASIAVNDIKLIRKFFTSKELLLLLTSNYYSVLYYSTEVWNIGSLKQNLNKSTSVSIRKCFMCSFALPGSVH